MAANQMLRRPVLVWPVAIYFLLSAILAAATVYLPLSGYQLPTAAMATYVAHLNWVDHSLNVVATLLNVGAAIGIFKLRRSAPYCFSAIILLLVVRFVRAIFGTSWLSAVGSYGAVGSVVGICIYGASCWYSWCLLRRGILR
jgi:hypothetical protein